MKLKLAMVLLCVFLLLSGCSAERTNNISTTQEQSEFTDLQRLPGMESEYPEAFVFVHELGSKEQVKKIHWDEVMEMIPDDYYQEYPGLHSAPLAATLCREGTMQELDVRDPRLIKLMNFYHNAVYNQVYSYSQGAYTQAEYDEAMSIEPRLELTYDPIWSDGCFETTFDKMVVYDGYFMGVRTDTPTAFDECNSSAFCRLPLHVHTIDWLELFGF